MKKLKIMTSEEFKVFLRKELSAKSMKQIDLAEKLYVDNLRGILSHKSQLGKYQTIISRICELLNIDDIFIIDKNIHGFLIDPNPESHKPDYMRISEAEFSNLLRSRLSKHATITSITSDVNKRRRGFPEVNINSDIIEYILEGRPDPLSYISIKNMRAVCNCYHIDPELIFNSNDNTEEFDFVRKFQSLMKIYSISQKEICASTGLSPTMLRKILNDEFSPSKSTIDSINRALDSLINKFDEIVKSGNELGPSNNNLSKQASIQRKKNEEIKIKVKKAKLKGIKEEIESLDLDSDDLFDLLKWIMKYAKSKNCDFLP